jgi:AbrB family looped-hinge helix DNA binding protein
MRMSEINQVTMDRSGKIRIPKAIRARLRLSPGAWLVIEAHNDEEIRLRPLREQPVLVDKSGVLVVRSAAVGDLEGMERREREQRLSDLAQGADG